MASLEAQIVNLASTLAIRFAHRTLAELPAMREACARLCQGHGESLQLLKRWAHKIRGTAASIGLAGVSARAEEIEDSLPPGPAAPVDAAMEHQLAAKLSALEVEISQQLAAGHREG